MSFGLRIVIGMLAAGLALVAFLAYRNTTPAVAGRVRALLVGLRVLALFLITLLLLDPRHTRVSTSSEPPHVIALIDRSASMTLPAEGWDSTTTSRFDAARATAERLRSEIEARKGRFTEVYFADDVTPSSEVSPDGQGTDIERALASVQRRYEGDNVAGILLVSDGIETEERLVRGAAHPVPVFTVGVGDTSAPVDVRVDEVDYPPVVRTPSRARIDASIKYSGDGESRVRVRLREGGRVIFEADTVLSATAREVRIDAPVDFRKPGKRRFVLEAEAGGRDSQPRNNRRDIVIEGEKAGVRILIVDLLPTWELHFLTDFLREDETYDFDLVSPLVREERSGEAKIVRPGEFLARLADFDALVLASVTESFVDDRTATAIKGFVRDAGKGLLVLPGPSSLFEQAGAWSRMSDVLPVRGAPPHRFNLQFTSLRPGAQAATNVITSQLVPLLAEADWQQRSPLLGYYAPLAPKDGVEVLLETSERRAPAFTYQGVGKGRVALLSAGPLWRWKFLGEGQGVYNEMVSRLLDVLTRGESSERFVITTRRSVYESGDTPRLTAEIFNEKMQPVTGVPVRLEVSRVEADGSEVPLDIASMQRESAGDSRFHARLPALPPGNYRVRGRAELSGRTATSPALDFTVSDVSVEFRRVAQDRSKLQWIAGQSGGAYSDLGGAPELAAEIPLEERVVESTTEVSLRTSALIFGIILLLLAVEWIIRKRMGMI